MSKSKTGMHVRNTSPPHDFFDFFDFFCFNLPITTATLNLKNRPVQYFFKKICKIIAVLPKSPVLGRFRLKILSRASGTVPHSSHQERPRMPCVRFYRPPAINNTLCSDLAHILDKFIFSLEISNLLIYNDISYEQSSKQSIDFFPPFIVPRIELRS